MLLSLVFSELRVFVLQILQLIGMTLFQHFDFSLVLALDLINNILMFNLEHFETLIDLIHGLDVFSALLNHNHFLL